LTPRLMISKNCRHLIAEMRKYRWMRGRRPEEGNYLNPKVAVAQPLKRDDDCCDALRYMLFSNSWLNRRVPSSVVQATRAPKAVQLAGKVRDRGSNGSTMPRERRGGSGMFAGGRRR
jgi:hypothetical protein